MTNKEKFIEVMNKTFGAEFTLENFSDKERCSPCGYYKKHSEGCGKYECSKCHDWWNKQYKQPSQFKPDIIIDGRYVHPFDCVGVTVMIGFDNNDHICDITWFSDGPTMGREVARNPMLYNAYNSVMFSCARLIDYLKDFINGDIYTDMEFMRRREHKVLADFTFDEVKQLEQTLIHIGGDINEFRET